MSLEYSALGALVARLDSGWKKAAGALTVFALAAVLYLLAALPVEALGERWGLEETSVIGAIFHLVAHLPPELLVHGALHVYLHQESHRHDRTLWRRLSVPLAKRGGKMVAAVGAFLVLVPAHIGGHVLVAAIAAATGTSVPELALFLSYLMLEVVAHILLHKALHRR